MVGKIDTSYCETSGIDYINYFPNNTSREKAAGPGLNTTKSYWLRSKSSNEYVAYITSSGGTSTTNYITNSYNMVLGFCT